MADTETPQFEVPALRPADLTEVADGVFVIPDRARIPMVPNVGIVVGDSRALIVDTGLGTDNAKRVLKAARLLCGARELLVTLTHFHPEHGFGAHVLEAHATTVCNASQWEELQEKGAATLEIFRGLGAPISDMLRDVEFVAPDVQYTGSTEVDLGGRVVQLREHGGGHSRSDQVVLVPGRHPVLFTGDLVEDRFFPALPDTDADVRTWIRHLEAFEDWGIGTVVPGHGEPGGPQLIVAYLEYFRLLRDRVRELDSPDRSAGDISTQVAAEVVAARPDWDFPDFVRTASDALLRDR